MIYVIVKRGVYRHEVVGACTNETAAIAMAMDAAKAERDDYHSFEVLSGADGIHYPRGLIENWRIVVRKPDPRIAEVPLDAQR